MPYCGVFCRHFLGQNSSYGWMDAYCPFANSTESGCIAEAPLGRRYLVSVYFVMTTLSSVGYGDVLAKSAGGTYLPLLARCLPRQSLVCRVTSHACQDRVCRVTSHVPL